MKCLIVLAGCVAMSWGLFEIDELQKLVADRADALKLEILDDDKFSPRSQIQEQINEILARQSPSVQTTYKMLIENERAKDEAEFQAELQTLRTRGASAAVLAAKQKLYDIDRDLSLSEVQADQQEAQVKASLSAADYVMLDNDD